MGQQSYSVEDFYTAILEFLAFDVPYSDLTRQLSSAVTPHTSPVDSGTVTRTQRRPIKRRAAAQRKGMQVTDRQRP